MTKEITEGKGVRGENCNVTHCQKPKSAYYYNHAMDAYYCKMCAWKIQRSAINQGLSFYNDLHLRYDENGDVLPEKPTLCREVILNNENQCQLSEINI